MKNWLVKFREQKQMTQEEVAELSRMPRTTYASIEQGRRNPSVAKAMAIADTLDFEWTLFFENELREKTQKNKEVIWLTKEEKIELIMQLVSNLDKYEWLRVSQEISQQYKVAENRVKHLNHDDEVLLRDRLEKFAINL